MKKRVRVLLLFVTMSACLSVQGQHMRRPSSWTVGMTLGANLTDIWLTADSYNIYNHQSTFHPILGTFFQYRTEWGYALRPELMYYGRGGELSCLDINYRLLSHCLGVRLGMKIDYDIPHSLITIYGILAPELTFTVGGNVKYTSKNTGQIDMPLSRSNMNILDLGSLFGFGAEIPLVLNRKAICLSVEVGYHFNLINSFTPQESSGNITVLNNVNMPPPALQQRLSGGFELTMRVEIPLRNNFKIRRLR